MIDVEETNCIICGEEQFVVEALGFDYLYRTTNQQWKYVKCATCGHLYLNPRPRFDQIDRIYPANYSSFSGKFSRHNSPIARLKDWVLLSRYKQLEVRQTDALRVLDVGCGDGNFLSSLRRHYPNFILHGLDWKFSSSALGAMELNRITPIIGAAEAMSLEDNYYDVVIMNQLVEHLWDPRQALKQCFSALKPGGLIALETPDPEGYDRAFFFRSGLWGAYYWPRHLNLFSSDKLSKLLGEIGFVTIKKKRLLAPFCWVYSFISILEKFNIFPKFFRKAVRDDKVWVLGPFAVVDLILSAIGFTTSNQKVLARKPE